MYSIIIFVYLSIFFHQSIAIDIQIFDIVQTAKKDERFSILVAALEATDLVPTLQGNGSFTVFAPTNAAFIKLSLATVADLLKAENKGKLTGILKYHVINGQSLTSAQINALNLTAKIQMLDGNSVTVSRNGTNLKVNDATVIIADIIATNGIIHGIDTVLIPPAGNSARYFGLNQSFLFILPLTILFSSLHFL